ncbi:MAG: hypothetical protein KDC90_10985 [Ignavibacteriae bacterium]|nr:hypothetical protein [Ignavibacteriota bacterium]
MKLIAPNNIFSTIFYLSLPEKNRPELILKESSLVTQELLMTKDALAIIPSLDLINHKDLLVSSKIAFSYSGLLSNAYLYYSKSDQEFKSLLLKGDVSSNEVILSKIIFKEIYNIEPKIGLDVSENFDENKNYLLTGNLNWRNEKFKIGNSFSEYISDFLEYPYVNYLVASRDEEIINKFHLQNEDFNKTIIEKLSKILEKINLGDEINDFIYSNQFLMDFNFNVDQIEGYNQLIRLLYYHQIIDDLFDVKFV